MASVWFELNDAEPVRACASVAPKILASVERSVPRRPRIMRVRPEQVDASPFALLACTVDNGM